MSERELPMIYVDGIPVVDGCDACVIVGRCMRCDMIVCWGHHIDVSGQIALPGEDLRERMEPDPMFADRCDVIPELP